MAITGPSSYVPTANEFLAHWKAADAALGDNFNVVVAGGAARQTLKDLRDSLVSVRDQMEDALNGQELASARIKIQKGSLLERFGQFAANVRALLPDSEFVNALPYAPEASSAESKFIRPMVDAANLWKRLEKNDIEVRLPGGFGRNALNDAIRDLRHQYEAHSEASMDLSLARGRRNKLQEQIYAILKSYRQLIPGRFVADDPIFESLPRLTPKPGHTPEPVNASAVWDESTQEARISWEASDEAEIKEYEVRYVPGEAYSTDDESVIGNISPEQERQFVTNAGLTQPGASAAFKVYVILETGNEAGSAAMVVTVPEAASG